MMTSSSAATESSGSPISWAKWRLKLCNCKHGESSLGFTEHKNLQQLKSIHRVINYGASKAFYWGLQGLKRLQDKSFPSRKETMHIYILQSEWPFLLDLWTVINRNIMLLIIHLIVFVFRSVKFLLSFDGETIHCPFHVLFNFSKKNSPQQSLKNFAT